MSLNRHQFEMLMRSPGIDPVKYKELLAGAGNPLGRQELSIAMVFGNIRIINNDVGSLYKLIAKVRCNGSVYAIQNYNGNFEERITMMGGLLGQTPSEISSYTVKKDLVDLKPIKMYFDPRKNVRIPLWEDTFKENFIAKILNTAPENGLIPAEELRMIDLQSFTTTISQNDIKFDNSRFLNFKLNDYLKIGVFIPNLSRLQIIENQESNLLGLYAPDKSIYTTTYRDYLLEQEAHEQQRYTTRLY